MVPARPGAGVNLRHAGTMPTYFVVSENGNAQEPTRNPVRRNGGGGVRQAWWWDEGPVDSCCCCCFLRSGVGNLAAMDVLLNGVLLNGSSGMLHTTAGYNAWSFYLPCMVATIAGAIGLWAVYNRSAFAAKVYLYTWPLKLLLHYASLIAFIFVLKSHGLEQLAAIFIFSETLYLVIFAYYTKVVWSYQYRLSRNPDGETYRPSGNTETSISLV